MGFLGKTKIKAYTKLTVVEEKSMYTKIYEHNVVVDVDVHLQLNLGFKSENIVFTN